MGMKYNAVKLKVYPLDQNLSTTWFIQYRVNGGKPQKKYGALNKLATLPEKLNEVARLARLIRRESDALPDYSNKDITVQIQTLSDAFEVRKLFIKKKTIQTYQSKLEGYVRWLRTERNEQEIEKLGLGLAFLKYLQTKNLSGTTLNTYRDFLNSLYKNCKELKSENPFSEIKKFREQRVSAKYYSKNQQDILRKEITRVNPQLWLACQMSYYLLLRPGDELRLIKVEDFDLDEQMLRVSGFLSKNDKTQSVRIPDEFLKTLQFLKFIPGSYYVFGSEGRPGMTPRCKKYFPDHHIKILRRLGFNTKLYKFYSWKHTGAVMYYQQTKDLKGLKEQGRWHSLDMVEEYLKNLGVIDMEDVKTKFPSIGNIVNL